MTTSNDSTTYNPAFIDISTHAYRGCNIINENETPTAEQYVEAQFLMNGIVAGLQGTGIHVWTEEEAIVFLQPGQARYIIGSPVLANNAQSADDASWVELQTTVSLAEGALSIPFMGPASGAPLNIVTQGGLGLLTEGGQYITTEQAYGLAPGNALGVVLASGSMFWTTVAAGTITSAIPITDPLPSAVNSGAIIVSYPQPAGIVRPLKVPAARLLTFGGAGRASDIEIPMTILSRQRYEDLPNKLAQGTPTQAFYSPQRDYGWLAVWPVPVTITQAARITHYRPLQSFLEPNNTADFPQEWSAPLRYLLMDELKLSYPVSEARAARIEKKAMEWTTIISGWDRDPEPVEFGLDSRFR